MTPETRAAIQARLKGVPKVPAPAPAPAADTPAVDPAVAEMFGRLRPELQASLAPLVLRKPGAAGAAALAAVRENATRQREAGPVQTTPAPQASPADTSPELTLGDVLDMDPLEAERAGLSDARDTIRDLRARIGGPNGYTASAFGSEWGQQKAENVRMIPLQRMTGVLGMAPTAMENRLTQLHFMQIAKREGLPTIDQMTPEQYAATKAKAADLARRDVASQLGKSEQRGNTLIDTHPDTVVQRIRRGEGLAAPVYATPLGGAIAGAHLREAIFGTPVEDQAMMGLLAPFMAQMKPGTASVDVQTGAPVLGAGKEGKLNWISRMGASTGWASWAFDPTMSWEIGGENGFGGRRHVEKVVSGYDVMADLPKIGDAYDRLTPWKSSHIEKTLAALIPVGAIVLSDPDALSIGTGLVGAPLAKGAKLIAGGELVVKTVFKPMIEELEALAKAGASVEEVAQAANAKAKQMGVAADVLWRAVGVDFLSHLDETVQEAADLNVKTLSGLGEATQAAGVKAQDTAQGVRGAQAGVNAVVDKKMAHVGAAQEDLRTILRETDVFRDRALRQYGIRIAKETQDAAAARVGLEEAEDRLIYGTVMRSTRVPLGEGVEIVDLRTGAKATVTRLFSKEVDKGLEARVLARGVDGKVISIPLDKVGRVGTPGEDTMEVFRALQSNKRRLASLERKAEIAARAGDTVEAGKIRAQMARVKSGMIDNLGDLEYASLRTGYALAKKTAQEAIGRLDRLTAGRAAFDEMLTQFGKAKVGEAQSGVVRAARSMDKAMAGVREKLQKAVDADDYAQRHLRALEDVPRILSTTLGRYRTATEQFLSSARKGTLEAQDLGRATLDELAVRTGNDFSLDGAAWRKALDARYGAEVVEQAMRSPLGAAARAVSQGKFKFGVEAHTGLRKFEESLQSAAELERRAGHAPIEAALATLRDGPLARGWSPEAWTAWSYQVAQKASRWTDAITASTIGRATGPVREVARRAYERLAHAEKELNAVAGLGGIAAVREFLTSGKVFDGIIGNRDTLTLADKGIAYLRSIARAGEVWDDDVVVMALSRAWMPPGASTKEAVKQARAAMRRFIEDPTSTGAGLVQHLEHVSPAIFVKEAGQADADQVAFRFIARGIVTAANQHDAMYDMMRVAGPGLDAKAARAMNFFVDPENTPLKALAGATAEDAYRAMAAYGLPYASFVKGKVNALLQSQDETNQLLRVADIEGHGHYIPAHVWKALNEVPDRLAKEMREWNEGPHWFLDRFDRMTRTWRVAAVNGWLVPRAAHFVNTFAGDWAQLTQSFGWKAGTRLALNNAAPYIPFVGPALQDALGAAARKNSTLSALFNPDLAALLRADGKLVVETLEGPMVDRAFAREMYEDGVWGSINTNELAEITARHNRPFWKKLGLSGDVMPQIEGAARFLEEAQHRSRALLYLEARTGRLTGKPMSRAEAKAALRDSLYDWKTGVPPHEHMVAGRLFAFLTYRRGMARQLGATLAEGFTAPSQEYWAKALSGRTRLARMRQTSQLIGGIPEAIYWQDPDQYLEDEEQLRLMGERTAPWWSTSQGLLFNRGVDPQRELWYSEVAGRKVSYESFMLPALTTMDQLYLLNMVLQTGAASAASMAEAAGLSPNITTVGAAELWERNVDEFTSAMTPAFDGATNNLLRPFFGEGQHRSDKGTPVPISQAILLKRLGWGDFLAAHPDPDGQIRVDPNVLGFVTNLVLSLPQVSDVARNWAVFDNPAMQESLSAGLREAASRWTGLGKPSGHDPFASRDYEAQAQERALKHAASAIEQQTIPRDRQR